VAKLGIFPFLDYPCVDDLCRFREIGLGFFSGYTFLDAISGWNVLSWGYHENNGKVYTKSGTGIIYGDIFGAGDVVGCYVNFDKGITFTKNGIFFGKRRKLS